MKGKKIIFSTGSIIKDSITKKFVFVIETKHLLGAIGRKSFIRFGTPGGKLKSNETPFVAFKRELNEEIKYKDFQFEEFSKYPNFFVIDEDGVKKVDKPQKIEIENIETQESKKIRVVFQKKGDFLSPRNCRPSLVFVFSGFIFSPLPKGEIGVVLELSKKLLTDCLNQNLTLRELTSRGALISHPPKLDLKRVQNFLKPVGTAELLVHLLNVK